MKVLVVSPDLGKVKRHVQRALKAHRQGIKELPKTIEPQPQVQKGTKKPSLTYCGYSLDPCGAIP
ncbi:hypothetical protein IJ596_00940 [bacterium]|nr:hypothetical protein [bacterium]